MSAVVLASGVLHKKPERKQAKSGNSFVAATLRVREADARYSYWRLTSFDEAAQNELLRLDDGDSVSVQGLLRAEIYKPEGGEPRLSMNVIVDQCLAARPKPRTKEPRQFKHKPGPSRRYQAADLPVDHHPDLNPANLPLSRRDQTANLQNDPHPQLNDPLPW